MFKVGYPKPMPSDLSRALALELRMLMAIHNKTQLDVANALQVSQGYVSRRLSGKGCFTVDELSEIADFFRVPDVGTWVTGLEDRYDEYLQRSDG